MSFAQICATIAATLEIKWPSPVRRFLTGLDVSNANFISLASVECFNSINFYTRFLSNSLIPIFIGFFIMFLFSVFYFYSRSKDEKTQEISVNSIRAWRIFLFILFFLYPSLSTSVLGLYVCRNIDSDSYLLSDFSVRCYTNEYTTYSYVGVFFILLYPVYDYFLK